MRLRLLAVKARVRSNLTSRKQQTNRVKTANGETQTSLQVHFCHYSQTQEKVHTSVECQTDPIGQPQIDDLQETDPFAERKYIVCESQLEVLLSMCRVCAKPCQVVKKEESGTSVKFSSDCQCGNTFTWLSQPYSRQLPLVNLVLAAAAFFTACSPTRLGAWGTGTSSLDQKR
ncbi:hypothetical protein ACOMHN_010391 [Nucella lapillus]